MPSFRPARVALALAGVLTLLGTAGGAAAQGRQSGLQITPDRRRILISKDVGGSRWAITRNLADGTVTGNVFDTSGGDPTFLFCTQRSATVGEVTLACYGASRCSVGPCGNLDFQLLAQVTLPQSFFLPADTSATPTPAASTSGRIAGVTERASGLQITPDRLRTLISKDVAGQRWAITRNADDDTVTGNVYRDAGDPLFVHCTQRDGAGTDVVLSCSGAAPCTAAPCAPEEFSFISEVTLPRSFFTAPPAPSPTPPASCGNGVVDSPAEECDGADLDGLDCADAVDAVFDCDGTLACRADCTYDLAACACPCEGDLDCGVAIACDPWVAACTLDGACVAGRCATDRNGSEAICLGSDPEHPELPRADQCVLP